MVLLAMLTVAPLALIPTPSAVPEVELMMTLLEAVKEELTVNLMASFAALMVLEWSVKLARGTVGLTPSSILDRVQLFWTTKDTSAPPLRESLTGMLIWLEKVRVSAVEVGK